MTEPDTNTSSAAGTSSWSTSSTPTGPGAGVPTETPAPTTSTRVKLPTDPVSPPDPGLVRLPGGRYAICVGVDPDGHPLLLDLPGIARVYQLGDLEAV